MTLLAAHHLSLCSRGTSTRSRRPRLPIIHMLTKILTPTLEVLQSLAAKHKSVIALPRGMELTVAYGPSLRATVGDN